MKELLTNRLLSRLARLEPKQADFEICDTQTKGFGVHVKRTKDGKGRTTQRAAFYIRTRIDGRLIRYSLGQHPTVALEDARIAAREQLNQIAASKRSAARELEPDKPAPRIYNPIAARRAFRAAERNGEGFGAVARRYVNKIKLRRLDNGQLIGNRSWRETERILLGHGDETEIIGKSLYVPAEWYRRRIDTITRTEVARVIDRVEKDHGLIQAQNVFAQLRRLFNWHAARDQTFVSPVVRGMAPIRPSEHARSRVLGDQEIRALWAASKTVTPAAYGGLVRLLLLTGQRRNEVADMERAEILDSPEGATWAIPGERRKGKVRHLVPLSGAAVDEIEALPRQGAGALIITTNGKTPFSGFSKAKKELDELMLAELRKYTVEAGGDPEKITLAPWRLHDLRRTAKTLMQRAGVRPDISERVLGHVIAGVEGVYDRHHYLPEKRFALEALAGEIQRVLTHQAANVVPLRRPRRRSGRA